MLYRIELQVERREETAKNEKESPRCGSDVDLVRKKHLPVCNLVRQLLALWWKTRRQETVCNSQKSKIEESANADTPMKAYAAVDETVEHDGVDDTAHGGAGDDDTHDEDAFFEEVVG